MMLNDRNLDKLLSLIGAVKPSDLDKFIKDNDLRLDVEEMYELISRLYNILDRC